MSASDTCESGDKFAKRLQALRKVRRKKKLQPKGRRKSLSKTERAAIFDKTGGRCHICGGPIEGEWQADHVFAHSLGGTHEANNYLPAHPICNKYRWFYGPEEFQWILKLGVWLRTHIERQESEIGRSAAEEFCSYERKRAGR